MPKDKLKTARELANSGLTLQQIGRARAAAYVLMETRAMLNNVRDMVGRAPDGERAIGWALSEVECRARTIGGALTGDLRREGIDPGHSVEDATDLWRELGEAAHLVRS